MYHQFRGYEEDARLYGVRALFLAAPPSEADQIQTEEHSSWNAQQKRWLDFVEEDLVRAHAVHCSAAETDIDAAREATWFENKVRALEGPPGTGKTTVAKQAVELALSMDLKVLWTTYTAQQASRMREVFGKRVDVNTCHAALGFDEDITSVGQALAPYGLVIVDEFQQLQAHHMEHINQLRSLTDRVAAFALLGDRYQMAGFGDSRIWHAHAWKLAVQKRI